MLDGSRSRRFLRSLAKQSLYRAGYYHARSRLAGPRPKRLIILMYHDLAPSDNFTAWRSIDDDRPTPSQFEAHLRVLTRRYRVVSMSEAVAEICEGGLREDSVAVTFDDGSETVYTVAYPLLVEYRVPATVFVVSDWVERDRSAWWPLLHELLEKADLRRAPAAPVARLFGPTAPALPAARGGEIAARRRFVRGVEPLLRAVPEGERTEKLKRLEEILFPSGDFVREHWGVLSWAQIEEMAANTIDFGSHTRTHVHIATTELSEVRREIMESKTEIERHTGRVVSGFAYPYGQDLPAYAAVEPLLRDGGFAYACNACPGSNTASSNVYSLYRRTLPLTTSNALIDREIMVWLNGSSPAGG